MNIGIGNLLLGLGCFKAVVGLAVYWDALRAVAQPGGWPIADQSVGAAALWFLVAAGLLVALGLSVRSLEQRGGMPTAAFGWFLAAVALGAVALMPANGAWLIFPIAALVVVRARGREGQDRTAAAD